MSTANQTNHFTVAELNADLNEIFNTGSETPFELSEAYITVAAKTTTGATVVTHLVRNFDEDGVVQSSSVSSWNDFTYFNDIGQSIRDHHENFNVDVGLNPYQQKVLDEVNNIEEK